MIAGTLFVSPLQPDDEVLDGIQSILSSKDRIAALMTMEDSAAASFMDLLDQVRNYSLFWFLVELSKCRLWTEWKRVVVYTPEHSILCEDCVQTQELFHRPRFYLAATW